jgi:abortive infection bacteriophage resistance protein
VESEKVKRPTTYQEQINLLKERGLLVTDENQAIEVLSKIN